MESATQTLIVSLAGLASTAISAGLGLYFTARSRSATLRQHLYERQLALVVRIVRIVGKVKIFAPIVLEGDGPMHTRALKDLRVKARQLSEAADAAAAILPTELYAEVQQLSRVVVSFLGAHKEGRDTSAFPSEFAGHAAKTALLARTFLGVDELSSESATLFTRRESLSRVASLDPAAIAASARRAISEPPAA